MPGIEDSGAYNVCPVRLSMSMIGTGESVFHKRILFDFEILLHPSFCFFNFAVCKLYDDILYNLDWSED